MSRVGPVLLVGLFACSSVAFLPQVDLLFGLVAVGVLLALKARAWPLLVWSLGALGMHGVAAWQGWLPTGRGEGILLRLAGASAWSGWLGAQLDWPTLAGWLSRVGLQPKWIEPVDELVARGTSLSLAFERRREAARARHLVPKLGRFVTHLHVSEESVGAAFERALHAEEIRSLRFAPSPQGIHGGPARGEVVSLRGAQLAVGPRSVGPIDLELESGEWLVVLGPSGSGKTTLLRALAGLTPIAVGAYRRLGQDIHPNGALDRRVALVMQNPEDSFLAGTARAELNLGLTEIERSQVGPLLLALGLGAVADQPLFRLSFGEQKRVALGAALVTRPRLLLLDEPTAGLDARLAHRLLHLVEAQVEPGASVVWVTHDERHLPTKAQRVLVIGAEGQVVFWGPRALALQPEVLKQASLWPMENDDG